MAPAQSPPHWATTSSFPSYTPSRDSCRARRRINATSRFNALNLYFLDLKSGKRFGRTPASFLGTLRATSPFRLSQAHDAFSLVDIIKSKPGPQMSYQVGFCFWLLSFEQNIAQDLNKSAFILSRMAAYAYARTVI